MNEILILAKKLQLLADSQKQFAIEEYEKKEPFIQDLVTGQMDAGIDGTGNEIRPEYSPRYARFKGFTTPNLKLTGAFHRSVKSDAESDGLNIFATDDKTDRLESKYGKNILSLTNDNINILNESVLPELQKRNEQFLK